MKAYTDFVQSKKLAEILPLESADMCYCMDDDTLKYDDLPLLIPYHKYTLKEYYIPCWSLSALLSTLPEVSLNAFKDGNWNAMVQCDGKMIYEDKGNPIDACYEMILNLHELKML